MRIRLPLLLAGAVLSLILLSRPSTAGIQEDELHKQRLLQDRYASGSMHQPMEEQVEIIPSKTARAKPSRLRRCHDALVNLVLVGGSIYGLTRLMQDGTHAFMAKTPPPPAQAPRIEEPKEHPYNIAERKMWVGRIRQFERGVHPNEQALKHLNLHLNKNHILLFPEQHITCHYCQNFRTNAYLANVKKKATFLFEGGGGTEPLAEPLEHRRVKFLAMLIEASVTSQMAEDIPTLHSFTNLIDSDVVGDLFKQLPENQLTPVVRKWIKFASDSIRDPNYTSHRVSTEEYFTTEIPAHREDYKAFTRLLGLAALQELKSMRQSQAIPYVPPLEPWIERLKSTKPITLEDSIEAKKVFYLDLRDFYMALKVMTELSKLKDQVVIIEAGVLHTPGIYWPLRHALDAQGLSDVEIQILPHSLHHDLAGEISGAVDSEKKHLKSQKTKGMK